RGFYRKFIVLLPPAPDAVTIQACHSLLCRHGTSSLASVFQPPTKRERSMSAGSGKARPEFTRTRWGRGQVGQRSVLSIMVLVSLLVFGFTAGAQPRHVTIGFTVSESGPYAAGSAGMREGLELWRDDVNARGGIWVGGVS